MKNMKGGKNATNDSYQEKKLPDFGHVITDGKKKKKKNVGGGWLFVNSRHEINDVKPPPLHAHHKGWMQYMKKKKTFFQEKER